MTTLRDDIKIHPHLLRYIHNSYSLAPFHHHDCITTCNVGTRQGDPIADVAFVALFANILHHVKDDLRKDNFHLSLPWDDDQDDIIPASTFTHVATINVSFVDDVAFTTSTNDPTQATNIARRTMTTIYHHMRRFGLRCNMQRAKTEALIIYRGNKSDAVSKQTFNHAEPTITFETQDGPMQLRLTKQYTHLGTVFDKSM
eukprot:TRINITY_DN23861_c1_g1_i4.p4 TRINITY_DN23861_c1_g1~~TRINITY_DN23861_c1_g1_i4.p4  ORF type:complete len:200 (-),score=25.91 TRINITY_DN23861_c1_g1_i4:1613-2212(-)